MNLERVDLEAGEMGRRIQRMGVTITLHMDHYYLLVVKELLDLVTDLIV